MVCCHTRFSNTNDKYNCYIYLIYCHNDNVAMASPINVHCTNSQLFLSISTLICEFYFTFLLLLIFMINLMGFPLGNSHWVCISLCLVFFLFSFGSFWSNNFFLLHFFFALHNFSSLFPKKNNCIYLDPNWFMRI